MHTRPVASFPGVTRDAFQLALALFCDARPLPDDSWILVARGHPWAYVEWREPGVVLAELSLDDGLEAKLEDFVRIAPALTRLMHTKLMLEPDGQELCPAQCSSLLDESSARRTALLSHLRADAGVERVLPDARAYDEGADQELARAMRSLQERRLSRGLHLQELLTEAEELIRFAAADRFSGCPARACAFEQLTSIWAEIDQVGYARAIAGVSWALLTNLSNPQCVACHRMNLADALLETGEGFRGRAHLGLTLLRSQEDSYVKLKVPRILERHALSAYRDGLETAAEHAERGARSAKQLIDFLSPRGSAADEIVKWLCLVERDNRTIAALATGELDSAARTLESASDDDVSSDLLLLAGVAFAAADRQQHALILAERAIRCAERRGAVRNAAKARLLAWRVTCALALEGQAQMHAAALQVHLASLPNDELRERAEREGAVQRSELGGPASK